MYLHLIIILDKTVHMRVLRNWLLKEIESFEKSNSGKMAV